MKRAAKSSTVTFRIPPDLEEALRAEAFDRQLTLNAFVTNSLRTSIQSAKLCKQIPLMPITGKTLAGLIQPLGEDTLSAIAKDCIVPQIKEISEVMFGNTDFSALTDMSNLFPGGSWFTSIARAKVNNKERFIARHGLGAKFSFFIGEVVKQYVKSIGLEVTYRSTENFVIIDVDSSCEVPEA